MVIPIQSEITITNEWQSTPTHLRVDLTEKMIAWIKKMMRVIKRNKIAYLADYECSPEYFNDDDGELTPCEDNLDCVMIVICKDEFYWKGLIKNTDIHFESQAIPITLVDDLIKFSQDPAEVENLPKYINDEDYSKREIALRRMRGET
jgi:hypothetical protein